MSQSADDRPEALTEEHPATDEPAVAQPPAADETAAQAPAADETAAHQAPTAGDTQGDQPRIAEQTAAAQPSIADETATAQPPAAEEAPPAETAEAEAPPAEAGEEEAPPAQAAGAEAPPAEAAAADAGAAAEGSSGGAGGEPGEATPEQPPAKPKRKGKKKAGQPEVRPQDVIGRIGDTNERALAYVASPDPKLSRMSRKVRDTLISDLPPVTAGALLGPAALARHFVASAASGRYRDLFALWDLFRQHPAECKPVLAERPQALDRARNSLTTAVRLGLSGRAERVAADIAIAEGLIWQWLRDALVDALPAVARRPAIASALLHREPGLELPLPDRPDERWLSEAAAARAEGPLAEPVERVLAVNADRLPATIATLALAHENYPDQVPGLIERVDLDGPEIGSTLAWARDHGYGERLRERAQELVDETASRDRAEALARWQAWRDRGIELALPEPLLAHSLEGLDLGRPETAVLIARLVAEGADIEPQAELDAVSARNRQLGEKAFEAFVCAGLDVTLPKPLAQNPIVRDGTRCPHCLAWTWVRPGHERRCPQRSAEPAFEAPAPLSGPSQPAANGAVEPASPHAAVDAAPAAADASAAADVAAQGAGATADPAPQDAGATADPAPQDAGATADPAPQDAGATADPAAQNADPAAQDADPAAQHVSR